MLPLKAFVNALQNTLRYSDCLVRAYAFFDRRLEHHNAGLNLKETPDGLGVEVPEFRHFAGRIMALGRSGRFGQRARRRERGRHGYSPPLSSSASDFETRSEALEAGRRIGGGTLLSPSGAGLGG